MRYATLLLLLASACEVPTTTVEIDNAYPASSKQIVYRAFWQAVRFTTPLAPRAASDPQNTVPASANTAWVLLAPGWDPRDSAPPTKFIVLESKTGFAVDLDHALTISVDDTTFAGNCGTGSHLDQAEADFITDRVFQAEFTGLAYDATSCTTSPR